MEPVSGPPPARTVAGALRVLWQKHGDEFRYFLSPSSRPDLMSASGTVRHYRLAVS